MQVKFFRLAKEAAYKSTHRVKIGSVLVNKGQVINVGWNKIGKTHPLYPWYLHSEMDCVLGIHRSDLTTATIYLFRINGLNRVLNCKPCTTCVGLLKELGVKRVCFTTGYYMWDQPEYADLIL